MADGRHHSTSRRGFAVRRLDELLTRPRPRDWDVRFVSATLLFYGLVGASFFLVDWLNTAAPDAATPAVEQASPFGDASDGTQAPYLVRLPKLLKDRADDTPQGSR